MTLKTLITGCPRGATQWAYDTLKAAGCSVGLNSVFSVDSTRQYTYRQVARAEYEIEVSFFSAPYLQHSALDGVKVVQLHRNPIDVASSLFWLGIFQASHNGYAAKLNAFLDRYSPRSKVSYRNQPFQQTLGVVTEWYDRYLLPFVSEHTCVKAEDGVQSLLEACDISSPNLFVPPSNVSGCRYFEHSEFDFFSAGEEIIALEEKLGYAWNGYYTPN